MGIRGAGERGRGAGLSGAQGTGRHSTLEVEQWNSGTVEQFHETSCPGHPAVNVYCTL